MPASHAGYRQPSANTPLLGSHVPGYNTNNNWHNDDSPPRYSDLDPSPPCLPLPRNIPVLVVSPVATFPRTKRRGASDVRCVRTFLSVVLFFGVLGMLGWWMGVVQETAPPLMKRVAVVGAGPSGISAAHHLAQRWSSSYPPSGSELQITIFDRSPQPGGRCQSIPIPGTVSRATISLSVPGFNTALDPLLTSLVDQAGLTNSMVPERWILPPDVTWDTGFWDGDGFRFRQPNSPEGVWYWWTSLLYFLRYGWAHTNLNNLISKVVPQWDGYISSITTASATTTDGDGRRLLTQAMVTNAGAFLEDQSVSNPFGIEQVQARTRAMWGVNLDVLSGMQAIRVMQGVDEENSGGKNVVLDGGFERLFTQMVRMLKRRNTGTYGARWQMGPSNAPGHVEVDLKLLTTVWGLRKNRTSEGKTVGWTVAYSPNPDLGSGSDSTSTSDSDHIHQRPADTDLTLAEFDEVVLAAPFEFTGININNPPHAPQIRKRSWEQMHVTVFTSPQRLAPDAFGLDQGDHDGMPLRVLTTLRESEQIELGGTSGMKGLGGVEWWSLETMGTVPKIIWPRSRVNADEHGPNDEETIIASEESSAPDVGADEVRTEYTYKILSPNEISNDTILNLLVGGRDLNQDEVITWIHRHAWSRAFPTPLPAKVTWRDGAVDIDQGLWYTGGLEGVWGGVEAAVTMGKRVADEVGNKWRLNNMRCFSFWKSS